MHKKARDWKDKHREDAPRASARTRECSYMADTKDSKNTTKDIQQENAKGAKATVEGSTAMAEAVNGNGVTPQASSKTTNVKEEKVTKDSEAAEQADNTTAGAVNVTTSDDVALATAQRKCESARQRVYQDTKKYTELKLLYVAGGKGVMPQVRTPETPFEDEQMIKAYDKLKRDVGSFIEARRALDRLRGEKKKETKRTDDKPKKPATDGKVSATGAAATQEAIKPHGDKTAKDGRMTKTSAAGKPQDKGNTKQGNINEHHRTEAAQKEGRASVPNATPAEKARKDKQTGKENAHANPASQQKPHREYDVTAKTDDTKDGSKPSDNGKVPAGKPIAQRTAKSDSTAGTDTQALAKRDASKPTPEASSNAPKRQAENAKPHGKKAGAGDAKDTKNADSTKTAVTDAAKKNDDTKKASMKKKPSEPKHDSNGNNGASIVTAGNDKPQSPNEHKRPPVTPASQEDAKATTDKSSAKDSTEHVDNHDVPTQHGKNDTAVPAAEKQRQQGAENKQTQGKGQQETVPPSHDNAGSTTEANIKPAIEQNIKPIAESGNAHDSKEVTANAPASVKVSGEQHATAPKQDENKAGIGDDDKQNVKQPDIEQHTASDEPAAAAASDAKPAERKAREASQKKTAKKQDVKQEDDATSHAAEQKVRKEQPVVTPSDDAESHDAAEKPAETSVDVAEHETVSENSVTEPDRMSCHDDTQTYSFDKAPDEVIERIGTLDEDAMHGVPVYAHRSRAQWSHNGITGRTRVHASTEVDTSVRSAQHMATDGGLLGRIGRAFRSLFGR